MASAKHRRILRFERLEPKASPCSLLLLLAPQADHQPTDEVVEVDRGLWTTEIVASNWRYEHSSDEVLQFIHDNTSSVDDRELQRPTSTASTTADEMMRLDDIELRTLIVGAGMASESGGIWKVN